MAFVPAYLKLSGTALRERVRSAEDILKECTLCPRDCKADRTAGETGFCKTGNNPLIASWGPHFGEESPLVGRFGSGTIFFCYCNLGCVFCQNWSISRLGDGEEMSFEELAKVMTDLQEMRCHNINLVTPTHQMPLVLRAIALAVDRGLTLPLVYNCGGYEPVKALQILDGIVDIYMPDIKYASPEAALKYSKVKDYPQVARRALKEMHRQVGDLVIDESGVARRGLLVRHLVLPGGVAGTKDLVRFIADEISPDTYINIMDQYHPCDNAFEYPPLDRRTSKQEYEEAIQMALDAGLKRIDGVTI
jgi:putative pyruvate formate lyase activating enzyme